MGLFEFFKSSKPSSKDKKINEQEVVLSLDDLFVNNFINKGGRFLYCISYLEALETLQKIVQTNEWKNISCMNTRLQKFCSQGKISVSTDKNQFPFFTKCEHLIASSGNIMMSSNQLGEIRINNINENFIVLATTSQIVKNMGQGLTGIKANYKENIPTNICEIKNFKKLIKNNDFLDYGVSNSKNLYLLLVEDL